MAGTSPRFQLETLESRRLLSVSPNSDPAAYQLGFDPSVGAVVTAFIENDPADPIDSFDIRTNWITAVNELADRGAKEVTFAVYRVVGSDGRLRGGPSISAVQDAVAEANTRGLSVTMLPLF